MLSLFFDMYICMGQLKQTFNKGIAKLAFPSHTPHCRDMSFHLGCPNFMFFSLPGRGMLLVWNMFFFFFLGLVIDEDSVSGTRIKGKGRRGRGGYYFLTVCDPSQFTPSNRWIFWSRWGTAELTSMYPDGDGTPYVYVPLVSEIYILGQHAKLQSIRRSIQSDIA